MARQAALTRRLPSVATRRSNAGGLTAPSSVATRSHRLSTIRDRRSGSYPAHSRVGPLTGPSILRLLPALAS